MLSRSTGSTVKKSITRFVPVAAHSHIDSFIHSLIYWFIHSFFLSFIHSLNQVDHDVVQDVYDHICPRNNNFTKPFFLTKLIGEAKRLSEIL